MIITGNPGPEDGTRPERPKALPQGYEKKLVSWKDRGYKSPRPQPGEVDDIDYCFFLFTF